MVEDRELDTVSFEAFSLAVRVMYHAYGIEAPAAEFEKPWALLREIATGETTLAAPAELAAKQPEMKDMLYDTANRIVEHDRETASRVLRGLRRAF